MIGSYTKSDFVMGMVTLAAPLAPNTPTTLVTPTAFTFSDGVQTITNFTATDSGFVFATGPTGLITFWQLVVSAGPGTIQSFHSAGQAAIDLGSVSFSSEGRNFNAPGVWVTVGPVPDTGSTLLLMTLTLMALGLVARRFQRAAA